MSQGSLGLVLKFLDRCFVIFVIFGFVCYLADFPKLISSRIDDCVYEHSTMTSGLFYQAGSYFS